MRLKELMAVIVFAQYFFQEGISSLADDFTQYPFCETICSAWEEVQISSEIRWQRHIVMTGKVIVVAFMSVLAAIKY